MKKLFSMVPSALSEYMGLESGVSKGTLFLNTLNKIDFININFLIKCVRSKF